MNDYLLLGPIFFLILGTLIGSFVNCLAWRLHQKETILGRSHCPNCLHKINWYDNIPILSFLILKRKCRYCSKKISWQYPIVEIITGLLFYLAFLFFGYSPLVLLKSLIIITTLILVFIFDFRWYLIPVSSLLWSGAVIVVLGALTFGQRISYYIFALIITASLSALFFGAQYLITRGKGIGEGDIWLGVFLGISFVNIPELVVAILGAYFIGSIVGLGLIASGNKKWGSKVPLGVFLVIGAIISLFWAPQITNWYLELFSF